MTATQLTTGYCTNIHAGTDLDSLLRNLREYAGPIRQRTRPLAGSSGRIANTERLGVGLWIPHQAARQLVDDGDALARLAATLSELGLLAYTFNGFPHGNFHQPVVKHRVYEPAWWQSERRDYTLDLIAILDRLLPSGAVGSISTLPVGWGKVAADHEQQAATHLLQVAEHLRQLEAGGGRRIVLAIEPEPGCHFDRGADVIAFFDRYVPREARRYLTVCHDICHAAVMGESQREVLRNYCDHGIVVGKMQVSSGIRVDWANKLEEQQQEALNQLSEFAEDRYLHQTGRLPREGGFVLAEDLPQLLESRSAETGGSGMRGTSGPAITDRAWCIHFHVPIFLDQFGALRATLGDIDEALQTLLSLEPACYIPHLEIETYAWSVLPEKMRAGGLVSSISREVHWLDEKLSQLARGGGDSQG